MTADYSDHYTWDGWDEGEEVDPAEPGKEWLTIREDGEEYAIIVLRTNASIFTAYGPERLAEARKECELRAERIVAALNALTD